MARSFFVSLAILVLALGVSGFVISSVDAVDLQTLITVSICGDGIVQAPEEACDEGPSGNLGGYASTTSDRTCSPGCQSFGPYCGDDILQVRFNEECDDGNHTDGDLCSATCQSETAVPPGASGSPTVGSTPPIFGATPGVIPSQTETRVVLRGMAYPNTNINILLSGKIIGTVRTDSNARFVYSTTDVTPGTTAFGFSGKDKSGTDSITTSVVFEVIQSAVTTVSNVFFPPTIRVSHKQVAPGELLTLEGQTIPAAAVFSTINAKTKITLQSPSDAQGVWSLQIDTASLSDGVHVAKAHFEQGSSTRSGFGKSVSFVVGEGGSTAPSSTDLSGDARINLVDFSIFLTRWQGDDAESDFNQDGVVNLADFSILLFNWTG